MSDKALQNSAAQDFGSVSEMDPLAPAGSAMPERRKRMEFDLGPQGSLRHRILSLVANEQYERAVEEIRFYGQGRPELPQFAQRTQRYFDYAGDLINAVRAKRSLNGMNALSATMRQDLQEKAQSHIDELRAVLKRVEHIEHELRMDDVRSTVWVLRAVVNSALLLLAAYILMGLSHGFFHSLGIVVDNGLSHFVDYVFPKLGL